MLMVLALCACSDFVSMGYEIPRSVACHHHARAVVEADIQCGEDWSPEAREQLEEILYQYCFDNSTDEDTETIEGCTEAIPEMSCDELAQHVCLENWI